MSTGPAPRLSVVIPAYYSSSTIAISLAALRRQIYRDFEAVVVNSSQEEDTARVVRGRYPEVTFIQSPVRLLPHAARNAGIERARGELLVFTDPDCEAAPDWLATLAEAYDAGVKAMVGAMGLAGDSWMEKGIHLLKFHWLLPGLERAEKYCAPTANAAYSRTLYEKIGPFNGEVFAGDGIMSWRAAQQGHPPVFVPKAVVRHRHDNSLVELCLQRYRRGKEYALVRTRHMGEPSLSTWLSLLVSWAAIGWVIVRAGKDAFRAGWGGAFLSTLPIQLAGHWAWAWGESVGALGLLFHRQPEGNATQ